MKRNIIFITVSIRNYNNMVSLFDLLPTTQKLIFALKNAKYSQGYV